MLTNELESVRVHVHWIMRIIYAFGIILFSMESYVSLRQGETIEGVGLGLFALLTVWAFLLAGSTIDVDKSGIRVTSPHGLYVLSWDEVKAVEIKGWSTYLYGENKLIQYNLAFAGKGKNEFKNYIAQSIKGRQVAAGRPPGIDSRKLNQMRRNAKLRTHDK